MASADTAIEHVQAEGDLGLRNSPVLSDALELLRSVGVPETSAAKGKRGEEPPPGSSGYHWACYHQSWLLHTWQPGPDPQYKARPYTCGSWRHPGPCQVACFLSDRERILAALERHPIKHVVYLVVTIDPAAWSANGWRGRPCERRRRERQQLLPGDLEEQERHWKVRAFEGLEARWRALHRKMRDRWGGVVGLGKDSDELGELAEDLDAQGVEVDLGELAGCDTVEAPGAGPGGPGDPVGGPSSGVGAGEGEGAWGTCSRPWPAVLYVSTVEACRSGWPHMNLILVSRWLAAAVAEAEAFYEQLEVDVLARLLVRGWSDADAAREARKVRGRAVAKRVLGDLLEPAGFGRIAFVEHCRSVEALADYGAKTAGLLGRAATGEGHSLIDEDLAGSPELAAEVAKLSQLPFQTPPHFRRLRSSRNFLPPRQVLSSGRTGAITGPRGLIAGRVELVVEGRGVQLPLPDEERPPIPLIYARATKTGELEVTGVELAGRRYRPQKKEPESGGSQAPSPRSGVPP